VELFNNLEMQTDNIKYSTFQMP